MMPAWPSAGQAYIGNFNENVYGFLYKLLKLDGTLVPWRGKWKKQSVEKS